MTDSWRPSSFIPLRLLTHRLASTPDWQLPHVVPILAGYVRECSTPRSALPEASTRNNAEETVLIHQFKTQVSAFLQGKTNNGKFTAIVLIKTLVEAAGHDVLHETIPWVRHLLVLFKRPGPKSTKKLTIITLTRIFLLTQGQATLIRELTTPSLPDFIAACISLTKVPGVNVSYYDAGGGLINTVLQAFVQLISHHPAVFRPFSPQIQTLVGPLLAPTIPKDFSRHNNVLSQSSLSANARRLFVLLHLTAPRNACGEAWTSALRQTMLSLHRTADLVFRALVEDGQQGRGNSSSSRNVASLNQEVADESPEPLPLLGWAGINAGIARLNGLILLIQSFLSTSTSTTVNILVSDILGVLDRVTSMTAPRSDKDRRVRTEISRDERESLFMSLPSLHISTINALSTFVTRLQHQCLPVAQTILTQILWIFQEEQSDPELRLSSYNAVADVVSLLGASIAKSNFQALSGLLHSCCEDLLPPAHSEANVTVQNGAGGASLNQSHQGSTVAPNGLHHITHTSAKVQEAAENLVTAVLRRTPVHWLDTQLRAQIDRTIVLAGCKNAMLASTINPATQNGKNGAILSILPLVAHRFPMSSRVDTIIHPQMPIIHHTSATGSTDFDEMSQDSEEHEDDSGTQRSNFPDIPMNSNGDVPSLRHVDTRESSPNILQPNSGENMPAAAPSIAEDPVAETPFISYVTGKRDRSMDGDASLVDNMHDFPRTEAAKRQRHHGSDHLRSQPKENPDTNGNTTADIMNYHETSRVTQKDISLPEEPSIAESLSKMQENAPRDDMSDSDDSEIPPLDTGMELTDDEGEDDEESGEDDQQQVEEKNNSLDAP
ncbi:uncharacterized protein KY384_003866 [Bacidia gigantensis]|uniref:uncharacterized protein n=1 Tax=Bacidia gigantensis TaxID=2732470 RepID=UPI001D040A6D|nr:uncharacterized protein KY384_003866 [Bacidia gigantensis]KAG8532225.1 hypothetical protein KY384_003866 [Bacidia gigantensis]